MENHTRLRTALFEDAFQKLSTDNVIRTAIQEKLLMSLANWALITMAKKKDNYLEEAIENFFAMGAAIMVVKGWDTSRVAKNIPLIMPIRSGRHPSPFNLLSGCRTRFNLLRISDEYQSLLLKLKEIRTKNRRNQAAFKMRLKEILPGAQKWIEDCYLSTEPSDIATKYLAQKYKLGIGAEALKKRLHLANNTKSLTRWIDKYVARTSLP